MSYLDRFSSFLEQGSGADTYQIWFQRVQKRSFPYQTAAIWYFSFLRARVYIQGSIPCIKRGPKRAIFRVYPISRPSAYRDTRSVAEHLLAYRVCNTCYMLVQSILRNILRNVLHIVCIMYTPSCASSNTWYPTTSLTAQLIIYLFIRQHVLVTPCIPSVSTTQ